MAGPLFGGFTGLEGIIGCQILGGGGGGGVGAPQPPSSYAPVCIYVRCVFILNITYSNTLLSP